MKTLIISSSLSKTSRSYILCKEISKRLSEKDIKIEFVDARNLNLNPCHQQVTDCMKDLILKVEATDNIIIGMGVHCYSINDGLKIILDNCFGKAISKFFGIACAAGGEKSYLSTQHLTQICMNEWRMIQLPRIVYATKNDFKDERLVNKDVIERLDIFSEEFYKIGSKLIS
tara:strand:+ start:342 stop:857 length:516 start_codon:yes stop_codon:yes gene_type:complete